MCILDALILNTDRHLGNFGVLVENDTQRVLSMAPVYDNNRSLLFDLDTDQLQNIRWCTEKCSPRIGTDFITTARGMMTDEIRALLYPLREFCFTPHPRIQVEEERLSRLSKIIRTQVERILS